MFEGSNQPSNNLKKGEKIRKNKKNINPNLEEDNKHRIPIKQDGIERDEIIMIVIIGV